MSTTSPLTAENIKNDTSTEKKSKSEVTLSRVNSLPAEIIKYITLFLYTDEIVKFRHSSPSFHYLYNAEMAEKKLITETLLKHVFNADPSMVKAFFANPGAKGAMVLTKSLAKEGYYSNKFQMLVVFRKWGNVSPLQAAALSLDNFLVKILLSFIEKDQILRIKAAEQLKEVLSKTTKDENKLKEEENGIMQNNPIEYADNDEYGTPFKALHQAYHRYNTRFDTLIPNYNILLDTDMVHTVAAETWNEIDRLWEQVGEQQKRLSMYGRQEYCDVKPFFPLPAFDTEPKRGTCHYWYKGQKALQDLDVIGVGSGFFALYKVTKQGPPFMGFRGGKRGTGLARRAEADSAAMLHLFKVRLAELKDIVADLTKPLAEISLMPLKIS